MNVYGSMDRQALDAAYNNSAAVADSERYLADWLRRSEVLRVRRPDHLDMIYGDAPQSKLDFFAAKRTGAPTLLFFHGGYWQRNAKEGFSFVAEGPLVHGFNVAVAGYTLTPEAMSGRHASRCIGYTSISRHWAASRSRSTSAAGRPAAISPRC